MDWEGIREDYKSAEEDRKKLVERICELAKGKIGCNIEAGMVHKWINEKNYEGDNPQPPFIAESYKQAIEELGGNE